MGNQTKKQITRLLLIFIVLVMSYCIVTFFKNNASQTSEREYIQFNRCVDGDTFDAKTKQDGITTIRLSGVNTPEIAHPSLHIKEEYYGKEAQEYTCNRLKNAKKIEVEWDNTQEESHNRKIAIIFIDGKNYNLELFSEGYSNDRYLRKTMPYAEQYREALRVAKKDKKGMWAKANIR